MNSLTINPADQVHFVSLNPRSGKFIFKGRFLPEDGKFFFSPVVNWLHDYAATPMQNTECTFKIDYFNSSSRKCFIDVFNSLIAIKEKGHAVKIIWFHDENDEEQKEIGEEYQSLSDWKFDFRPY